MKVGETCTFYLQAANRNQTLLFKLQRPYIESEEQLSRSDHCWNHALELYSGNIKPEREADWRLYCVKDRLNSYRYWYRSQGTNMTIVFTKTNKRELLYAQYKIDDCECRQGPLCERPCKCNKGYSGLCRVRTCEAPTVLNAAGIVQMESTGLAEGNQYSIGSVISFYCVEGFRISGYNKLTCTPNGWFRIPPKCIANNFIQETFCKNKYIYPNFDPNLKYRTTVPPYKRVQALVSKVRQKYRVNTKLTFQCTNGYYMENMYEIRVVEISCRDTGEWTIDPWPMCEEITCPTPSVQHAQVYVVDEDQLIPASHRVGVGTKLKYKCDYGYYMKGDSELVCQKFKYYKETVPECIDKDVFYNRCKRAGKEMKFDENDSSSAYCAEEAYPNAQSPVSLNTLTVVTAAAATVFGVLLLVIALVAYQRRRIVQEMQRVRRERRDTMEGERTREQPSVNANNFHFFLPSYDEAIQSTPASAPPSFAEATGDNTVPNDDDDVSPSSNLLSMSRQMFSDEATGGLPVYVEDISTSESVATEDSTSNIVDSTSANVDFGGLTQSCISEDDVIIVTPSSSLIGRRLASQSSGDSFLINESEEEASLLG